MSQPPPRNVSGAKTFVPCPDYEGAAVCVDVTEPKLYTSKFKDQYKFKFVFEVDLADPNNDGKRFCVWSRPMTETVHPKASLRLFLESWLGRHLTPEEVKTFNLETMVGRSADLIVAQETRDGDDETYANIKLIRPARPGAELKPSGNYKRGFEREAEKTTKAGGAKFVTTDAKGGPPKPASKTAPGAAADDPKGVVVHIGKHFKGQEVGQLPPEHVKQLIEGWLHKDFKKIPKPTADDLRLATSLTLVEAELAAAEAPAEPETEPDPGY